MGDDAIWQRGDRPEVWSNSWREWLPAKILQIADENCELLGHRVRKGSILVESASGKKVLGPDEVAKSLRKPVWQSTVWQVQMDDSDWHDFHPTTSDLLSQAKMSGKSTVSFSMKGSEYEADLLQGFQMNKSTKRRRNIREKNVEPICQTTVWQVHLGGSGWCDMDPDTSSTLSQAKMSGQSKVSFLLKGADYEADFLLGVQVNTKTKFQRTIRPKPVEGKFAPPPRRPSAPVMEPGPKPPTASSRRVELCEVGDRVRRRPCRDGAGCVRTDIRHTSAFSHPGDSDYQATSVDLGFDLPKAALPPTPEFSKGPIQGNWTSVWSGGVNCHRHHSPHVLVALKGPNKVRLVLKRPDSKCGLVLQAFNPPSVEEPYLTSEGAEHCLYKSKYMATTQVDLEVDVTEKSQHLLLLPMSETPGLTCSFSLEAEPVTAAKFYIIPAPKMVTVNGSWETDVCGGSHEIVNPQMQITILEKSQVSLDLEFSEEEGHMVHILRAHARDKRKKRLIDADVVAKSKYLNSRSLNLDAVLSRGIYNVVVGRHHAHTAGNFKLTMRSNTGTCKMLPNKEPTKPEVSAKHIIDMSRYTLTENVKAADSIFLRRGDKVLEEIRSFCRSKKGMFMDEDFKLDSIVSPSVKEPCVWKRVHEICDDPCLYIDGVNGDDLTQNRVGNCWFLSALSCVAMQYPSRLQQLIIPSEYTEEGIYGVRLFWYGEECTVFVDDRVPTYRSGALIGVSDRDPNEIWPLIVEKAFAKVSGGYPKLRGGHADCIGLQGFLSFLLGPTSVNHIKPLSDPKNVWQALLQGKEKGHLMTCGTPDQPDYKDRFGLVPEHAYGVVDVVSLGLASGEVRLVKLRNPWGQLEWNGAWSDSSVQWTAEAKSMLSPHTNKDDGTFFMDVQTFCEKYDDLNVCNLHSELLCSRNLHGEWAEGFNHGQGRKRNPQFLIAADTTSLPGAQRTVKFFFELRISHELSTTYKRQSKALWMGLCKLPFSTFSDGTIRDECIVEQSDYLLCKTLTFEPVVDRETLSGRLCLVPTYGDRGDTISGKFHLIARASCPFKLRQIKE